MVPKLHHRHVAWALTETAGFAMMVAMVFVFLRPIMQFIYFQF